MVQKNKTFRDTLLRVVIRLALECARGGIRLRGGGGLKGGGRLRSGSW